MQQLRLLALLGGLVLTSQMAFGQMRGWEAGGWIGASKYFGDLNTDWRLDRLHLSGGIGGRYNFNDRLCLKVGANVGQISAYDSDSKNTYEQRRNLHFRSLIADVTAQLEFNFMPYIHGHREFFYTPYMFIGPSFYYSNPQAELDGKWYDLRQYGTEGQFQGEEYSIAQASIAYGIGFKIDVSYRWSLNVELGARKLFSDYIDDVSGTYADVRDIRAQRGETAAAFADRSVEPQIGLPGRQRGNGKKSDSYALLNVGAFYYFGSIRCPAMMRN